MPLPQWARIAETFVVRIGFPAAVTAFVLYRLDTQLSALTQAVNSLALHVQSLPH